MKLVAVITAFALSASALVISPRAGAPGDAEISCNKLRSQAGFYNGAFNQGCKDLIQDCLRTLNETQSTDVWAEPSCVVGASCGGADLVSTIAQCDNNAIPNKILLANLTDALYETIAQSSGEDTPITQDAYVQFVFDSLDNIGEVDANKPSEDQVVNWWNVITTWVATHGTGQEVSYTNFNAWLHLVFDANLSNPDLF